LRTDKVDRLVAEAVGVMNSFFEGSSDSGCCACDSGGEEAVTIDKGADSKQNEL
jgi:hypothetical protein